MTMVRQLLTVREVAAVLRVAQMTVYRMIQRGEIPAVRIGSNYRLRPEDVEQFVIGPFGEDGGET